MSVYEWILAGCWTAFIVVWFVSWVGAKRTDRRAWRRSFGIRLIFVVVLIVVLHFTASRTTLEWFVLLRPGPLVAAIGDALCVGGVAVAIWARLYLGRNWGQPMTLQEGHELVTDGPYRYVRHPIYAGVLAATLGTALAVPSWSVIFVFMSIFFAYSMRQEERMMSEQFPSDYPAYAARTKRLVPFIW